MIELTTHKADIAEVRLSHGRANALDLELCRAITEAFAQCRSSSAIVLTGRGGIFSAGVDLIRLLGAGTAYIREFLPALSSALEAVFFHPRPVIAAINGHAIAGGCVMACAADGRLMTRGAGRMGVTELLVGVPFPQSAFEIMRAVAAPRLLHSMLYSGVTYVPEVAAANGLVDELVEADRLIDSAIQAAERLAALPPAAFELTKRQSRQPALDRLRRDGPGVDVEMMEIWLSPQTHARIHDYVARTLKKG
jgi:enoyl-CoA hydratase